MEQPPPFHNVQPRTREERQMPQSKAATHNNVLAVAPNSALFIDEHSRFALPKAVDIEHQRRQENLQKKEALLEQRRAEGYWRSEKYWNANVEAHDKVEHKLTHKREAGEGGTRRNKGSSCYNILTLDYEQSPQGQALQYKDETVQYKAALRAQNLYNKGHSTAHNIITGAPVWQPPQPSRPVAPWEK